VLVDLLTGAVAAVVTGLLAFKGPDPLKLAVYAAAVAVVWVLTLSLSHGYERRYLGTTTEEYRAVFRGAVGLFCLIAFASYALRLPLARDTVVIILPLLMAFGLVARHTIRRRLYRRRLHGRDLERTVVIGDVQSIGRLIREIRRAPSQGMHVVAACVSGLDTGGDHLTSVEGVPVFGYPTQAMSTVDLFDAEVVAVSNHLDLENKALRRLSWALEERGVDLVVAPGIVEVAGPRLSIRPVAGVSLLHVERPVMSGARRLVKATFDRCMSIGLFLVAAPVLAAIALAVRLDSPGPALFRQTRVGARGEEFEMLKFRTMCVDAEARLAELKGDAGNDVLFKMRHDPRITRIGGLLRRYSLDELPQLINVLRGEMSLVGPRPPLPSEVAGYAADAVRRLRVQPGLTGLWQVSGRSDLSWDESLRLDLWYVDNWSLVLDLQIIFRTARAVLRGQGAY
jgi:exopolysaccharide biosynthesis polyprenyl glycosylphosphotransferase